MQPMDALWRAMESKLNRQGRLIIGIDGMSASGKTGLAQRIHEACGANVYHMDDFFLTPDLRTLERLNEPGGNVDYVRFEREVLDAMKKGEPFAYHPFHCKSMSLSDPIQVVPGSIEVIEGAYSLHPYFKNPYDLRVFMRIDAQRQRKRILKRNGEQMLQRFENEWIPMEHKYFEAFDIQSQCELIIEG
jgi:Uridine kinase